MSEAQAQVKSVLGDRKLIVVSNREPYLHVYVGDDIMATRPVSGLVTGLEPVLAATGGSWVAYGSGEADRDVVDADDRVAVPPGQPTYRLRRVWLDRAEEDGYYYGFSNQALWPLCHHAFVRPLFEPAHWAAYQAVNQRFADVVLKEAGGGPAIVFIQDYHFGLLPRLLKQAEPGLRVAQFWHIPWPSPDAFLICPWAEDLVEGLLANDLLGFQTTRHLANFQATVERLQGAPASAVRASTSVPVQRAAGGCVLGAFPIGVDFEGLSVAGSDPGVAARVDRLRRELGLRGQRVLVGVDRVDYTKGIPERFQMLERLLAKYPEHIGTITFLQVGPISRIQIGEYQRLNDTLYHLMVSINHRFGGGHWTPLRMLKNNYGLDELLAFYRLADLCAVTPLDDGMNLVAKEFLASRADGDGVLLLSRFAGAAEELTGAVMVNPHDIDGAADALHLALRLPEEERRARMARMRESVRRNSVFQWAQRLLQEAARAGDRPPS